jgi:hypothetical protein
MPRYTLSEEGFDNIRKATTRRGVVGGGLAALVAATVFAFLQANSNAELLRSIVIFAVVFGVFFGVTLLGMRRSIGRLRDFWETFELRLEEERLVIKHAGAEKTTLKRKNVARIGETADEGLWVSEGDAEGDLTVHIPREVERYDEIRSRLSQWAAIEAIDTAPGGLRVPLWAWLVVFAIAYAVILLVNLWWVVVPVGLILVGVGGFFAYSILRNPNVDGPIKLGTVVIGLMILSVLFRIGFVLLQALGPV